MELTPIEQLDEVLKIFKTQTGISYSTVQEIFKKRDIIYEDAYILEILKKLEKDGYLRYVKY